MTDLPDARKLIGLLGAAQDAEEKLRAFRAALEKMVTKAEALGGNIGSFADKMSCSYKAIDGLSAMLHWIGGGCQGDAPGAIVVAATTEGEEIPS